MANRSKPRRDISRTSGSCSSHCQKKSGATGTPSRKRPGAPFRSFTSHACGGAPATSAADRQHVDNQTTVLRFRFNIFSMDAGRRING